MRRISKKTSESLENDPRMKRCALRGIIAHDCSPKLEWHHNLIYAGRQSDIPHTIIAICSTIHEKAGTREVKNALDKIMHELLTEEDYKLIPKYAPLRH